MHDIEESSTIQLNHVAFIRNKFKSGLLSMESNSSTMIQNNTMIENAFSWKVYYIGKSITIQLNHVAFTRNNLGDKLSGLGRILALSSRTIH